MKRLLLLAVWLCIGMYPSAGQNKIANPSFEDFASCPSVVGAVQDPPGPSATVSDWYKAGMGSTDFYNSCATGQTGVPANVKGWQQPRTGNGYAGFYAIAEAQLASREYLQCALLTPMQTGHRYRVSFWLSLGDTTANGLKASDEVGAYFSNGFMVVGTPQISSVTPQVKQPAGNFLSSTLNWMEVKDTFTASANETHMIIGVFSPFSSQTYQVISGPPAFYQIYYYIDDVCVLDLDETSLIETFDTAVCDGASHITLTARSGMEAYAWSNGSTAQQTTVYTSGSYWVKTYGACEMRVDTFHVSLFSDSGNVDLGPDTTVCFNSNLSLNAYRPAFTGYLWNTGAITAQIPVNTSGTYFVTATSACGTFSDTIVVVVKNEVPALVPLDTLICTGEGYLDLPLQGTHVTWYDIAGGQSYTQQPSIDLGREGAYAYLVTQTIDGCESDSSRVQVVVISPPYSDLRDTAVCNGTSITLGIDRDAVDYLWSTGDDSCCITVHRSGQYYLTLSNFCGTLTDSVMVSVLEHCDNCAWIPSAFSPNADGLNDVFEVRALCPLRSYMLHIYNRFGQLMFTGTSAGGTWDGSFHGSYCDGGVYYYYLEATPDVGEKKKLTRKGEITLIR